ncbi:hypothetical protein [Halobacillus litoralis]|uniref:hypothetical protein n=1 Tax=Halobacillus litoralis TaxID=45668 RepID=UPI001CD7803B|nr:hypothetical protein [Halobacillus litoralis]MCA1021582.1 hypothetical protein [Halobacillus litoralis]
MNTFDVTFHHVDGENYNEYQIIYHNNGKSLLKELMRDDIIFLVTKSNVLGESETEYKAINVSNIVQVDIERSRFSKKQQYELVKFD